MNPDGQRNASPRFDVVAVGESMLTLYRDPGTAAGAFAWDICGAESNVALYCAALGLSSAWVSRLDTGMAGSLVLDAITAGGADTSLVGLCEHAPTGLMLRDSPDRGQRVQYYRRGSAASLMCPETVPIGACLDTRAVHLTGITLALSDGCRDLVMALLSEPAGALRSFDLNWRPVLWPDGPPGDLFLAAANRADVVFVGLDEAAAVWGFSEPSQVRSFDLNWRPVLWPDGPPGDLFLEAANRADVVFVGLDEAAAVWGFSEPSQVRSALPRPQVVVVKDGAVGVHTFAPGEAHFEPALRGPIVGPRGAGDAFAAGFLCGYLSHPTDLQRCQRLGHVVAMSAMTSELDVGPLPDAAAIDAMLALDAAGWREAVYPAP